MKTCDTALAVACVLLLAWAGPVSGAEAEELTALESDVTPTDSERELLPSPNREPVGSAIEEAIAQDAGAVEARLPEGADLELMTETVSPST